MARTSLPVMLHLGGDFTCELGTVDLPIVTHPAHRDSLGMWQLDISVDHVELRKRIAEVLRGAADLIEEGPADGQ